MTNKVLPDWYKGHLNDKGDICKNPFSGKKYELNNIELSMYEYIIGTQILMEMQPENITQVNVDDLQRGLDWFKENNLEAYRVLLD
jgi:hypothetical protein